VPAGKEIKKVWDTEVYPAFEKLAAVIDDWLMPVIQILYDYFMMHIKPAAEEVARVFKDVVIWVFHQLANIINNILIPAIKLLVDYYHAHEDAIKTIIDWLVYYGKWILIIVGILVGVLVVALIGPVVAAFMAVVFVIGVIINAIITAIEWVKAIIHWFKWLINEIKSVFTVATLEHVGELLIDGLVRGIKNGFSSVRDTITNLGKSALHWFGQALGIGSPSKEFMKMGQDSMAGYVIGLKKTIPALEAQVVANTAGLTNAVATNSNPTPAVTQSFTINTQEINPRRHAAELGHLLYGRM
jgi:hypothetical protein